MLGLSAVQLTRSSQFTRGNWDTGRHKLAGRCPHSVQGGGLGSYVSSHRHGFQRLEAGVIETQEKYGGIRAEKLRGNREKCSSSQQRLMGKSFLLLHEELQLALYPAHVSCFYRKPKIISVNHHHSSKKPELHLQPKQNSDK